MKLSYFIYFISFLFNYYIFCTLIALKKSVLKNITAQTGVKILYFNSFSALVDQHAFSFFFSLLLLIKQRNKTKTLIILHSIPYFAFTNTPYFYDFLLFGF